MARVYEILKQDGYSVRIVPRALTSLQDEGSRRHLIDKPIHTDLLDATLTARCDAGTQSQIFALQHSTACVAVKLFGEHAQAGTRRFDP
jgi:hypothetical protein